MSSINGGKMVAAESLRTSRYDRVASLLISTLILSGTSVIVLVVLWLSAQRDPPFKYPRVQAGAASFMSGPCDVNELQVPQLSELSQFASTTPFTELATVLSSESIAEASRLDVTGMPGDPRREGVPLPPEEVPRWERWEIRYEAANLRGYARQLDHFGIELGAIGKTPLVDYAANFTATAPTTRSGSGSDEQRLYFSWRDGRLQGMDRQLLETAGVDVAGRTLLQFYPQAIENTLARLEIEHTKDGQIDELRKTIFGVRRTDDGYEFFIIEQRW